MKTVLFRLLSLMKSPFFKIKNGISKGSYRLEPLYDIGMTVNIKRAKGFAESIIKEYQIPDPIVPAASIAESKGLKVKIREMPEGLKSVSGFFDAAEKTIYVNINDPFTRQNFTIAHELGHYVLGHDTDKYGVLLRFPELNAQEDVEKEANCFAANLLVPEHMLRDIMKRYSLKKEDAPILAQMFGVSLTVMGYRLTYV